MTVAKKNKLSIYLVKEEYEDNDRKIIKSKKTELGYLENIGTVYYVPSMIVIPKWVETFYCGKIEGERIFNANSRVVLVTRVDVGENGIKTFVITMGHGNYMLEGDIVEEDFGLKVVLNTIGEKNIRRINKLNIGGNQKISNEQLPASSRIEEFGFDIDCDLISTITGNSENDSFLQGMMTGSSLLSVNAEVDINNIQDFLVRVYKKYISQEYKKSFGWIDHIRKVKDTKIVSKLEQKVIELIKDKSPSIWMAVPDVLEWENVYGFDYAEEIENDIYIEKVIGSLKRELSSYNQLRSKTISAISSLDDTSVYSSWKAYKCLCGEFELDGKVYCISNGNWYVIDKDFVKLVNDDYEAIAVSDMEFMDCLKNHDSENAYSKAFVKTNPNYFLCMDTKTIYYGGGRSQIELCDILTVDKKYIHIKPYSGSSTLSHLFNQAVISAEMVLADGIFVDKANEKIKELTTNEEFIINQEQKPHVILAIMTASRKERPALPFFSKVALRYTKRRLETLGCKLELKNIYREKKKK